MKTLITSSLLLLVVFSGTSKAQAETQFSELEIKSRIESPLNRAQSDGNLTYFTLNGPQLLGVDGPKTISAGESGMWNQTTNHGYGTFKLVNMRWTWGDGSKASSENSHVYKKTGTYRAKVDGLDAKGNVVDSVSFKVKVTKPKKYGIKITNFDVKRDYEVGSSIPVTWKTTNVDSNASLWTGFRLIDKKTGEEYFLTDAMSQWGGTVYLDIHGTSEYSQDGPIPPGKYQLEVYLYGQGTKTYPSARSKSFDIIAE